MKGRFPNYETIAGAIELRDKYRGRCNGMEFEVGLNMRGKFYGIVENSIVCSFDSLHDCVRSVYRKVNQPKGVRYEEGKKRNEANR